MNKVDKFLAKLDTKTRAVVKRAVSVVKFGNVWRLDVRKIKGTENCFRVRVGRVRIIFMQTMEGNTILDVSFRDDNTYSKF